MEEYCTSCGIKLVEKGFVTFPCPMCGDFKINRCVKCRKKGNLYVCEKCGLVGP